jgi:hypothetical protein
MTAKKISFIASFIRFYTAYVLVMCPQRNTTPFPVKRSRRLSFVTDKAALVNPPKQHSGKTEMDTPAHAGTAFPVAGHDRTAVSPLRGDFAVTGM